MMISKLSLQVQRSPFAGFIEIILKTRLTVSGERREDESLNWYSCWSLKVLNPYCFKGQKTMMMWNAQIMLVNQRCWLLFLKPQFWLWKKTKNKLNIAQVVSEEESRQWSQPAHDFMFNVIPCQVHSEAEVAAAQSWIGVPPTENECFLWDCPS